MNHRMLPRIVSLLAVAFALAFAGKATAQVIQYDGQQAGQDAYQAAESQRRAAIEQQRELNDQLRWRSNLPYYLRVPAVADYWRAYAGYPYPYPYIYNPRRAYRQGLRYGTYPHAQPVAPRGPSDSIYRPTYAKPMIPTPAPQIPPSATPPPPAPQGQGSPGGETIPAPPSEPGAREF